MKKKDSSYALSLSYQQETKHYKIDHQKTSDGVKFAIERGPKFDSLMDVRRPNHALCSDKFGEYLQLVTFRTLLE